MVEANSHRPFIEVFFNVGFTLLEFNKTYLVIILVQRVNKYLDLVKEKCTLRHRAREKKML